jgi:membrane peptidoglycan carboxypeptidase
VAAERQAAGGPIDAGRRERGRPVRAHRMPAARWVLILVALAALAAGAGAWEASPAATALGARVASRLHDRGASPVSPADIPQVLRNAVIATEDERFYHHHGIDIVGVIRALPYDIVHLSFAQGASTITEQVAKMLYLDGNDHTPWRKLEDAAVALKLESRYTKTQILAAYLNSAYFGEGAYGVGAASERYFGLPVGRVGLSQASLLAGLIQAPSAYDPLVHPATARWRQAAVLRSLVRNGYVTAGRATSVLARRLRLRGGATLPPVTGVDLSPGPAFVWWQLTLGAAVTLAALAALVVLRLRAARGQLVLRVVVLAALAVGAAAVVRSFRSA